MGGRRARESLKRPSATPTTGGMAQARSVHQWISERPWTPARDKKRSNVVDTLQSQTARAACCAVLAGRLTSMNSLGQFLPDSRRHHRSSGWRNEAIAFVSATVEDGAEGRKTVMPPLMSVPEVGDRVEASRRMTRFRCRDPE